MSPLYWLLAVGVLLVLEMLTLGLTTIWFAGGAFVAFLASLCHASVPVRSSVSCRIVKHFWSLHVRSQKNILIKIVKRRM